MRKRMGLRAVLAGRLKGELDRILSRFLSGKTRGMTSGTILLIASLGALGGVLASGPQALAASTLSWQELVSETARGNSELKATDANRDATVAAKRSAEGGYYPQVSAGIDAARVSTSGAERASYTAKISVTQNLFAGFGTRAKVQESEAGANSAAATRDQVRAKVSYDLKAAVANFAYAQEAVRLSREIIRRREDNLNLVELRFEGGRENSGSVAFSRSLLADAKYQEQEALQNLISARLTLARVLGRDSVEGLEVTGQVPLAESPPARELEGLAKQTPESRIAQAGAEVQRARVGQARAKFLPTLDLVGAFGKTDDRFFPKNDEWSATLSLKVPLFTGGTNYYGYQSAASSQTAAEATEADTARKVLVDLQTAHKAFELAVARLRVDQEFVSASVKRAEIARQKYDNGLLSYENWDIIETELISRERALLQSRRDRTLSEAAWEKALGKSVF